MNDKYKELFSYISDTDESCASDILYSLELVKTSLNTTLKRIKKKFRLQQTMIRLTVSVRLRATASKSQT